MVTISLGRIFLLVPPSLGCHIARIRPLFHALGKLPSFCDPEKPLGASPGALPCAPAAPAPHRSPTPSWTVSPPSTSCPTCRWLSPAGNQGVCGGRGSAARNRAGTGTSGQPGGLCSRGGRGSVRERRFCRGEGGLGRSGMPQRGRRDALGVPAVPAPSRGSLSPASRRRRPGTSAGTAGAAGPRGRPRRCRRPGRWRAGPGRTGGGTTASRRRVGRGRRRREALAAPLRLGSGVGDLLAARRLYKPFS